MAHFDNPCHNAVTAYIDHREQIGEGGAGDQKEEDAVDVLHPCLITVDLQVDEA